MSTDAPPRHQAHGALAELVEERGESLIRYATWLCGDRSDAEDLVQDALAKVFAAMRRPGPGPDQSSDDASAVAVEHAEAYVRRTLVNLYVDGCRRRGRWAAVRHLAGRPDYTAGPEQASSEHLDLERAVTALPPRQRASVVLRFYADRTVSEIAVDLGVTTGTVKRLLHDANAHLALTLAPSINAAAELSRVTPSRTTPSRTAPSRTAPSRIAGSQ